MTTLKFYGYSDDTFGEYGVTNQDVDNCASQKPIQCVVNCEGKRMMVVGQYSAASRYNGCWLVGATKVEEEDELPDWPVRVCQSGDVPYSTCLEIDLPSDDFSLEWFNDDVVVEM